MQALGGLDTRGEGESAEAGATYATLAMAGAARQSPAGPRRRGARVHAHRRALAAADPARKRARTAWTALGSPRRLPVTGELAIIAFGHPPSLVVEFRARRRRWRGRPAQPRPARGGRTRVPRRDRHAAVRLARVRRRLRGRQPHGRRRRLRFLASHEGAEDVELRLDAPQLGALRAAVSDALGGLVAPDEPGCNAPCSCGSGSKYKKCCGR